MRRYELEGLKELIDEGLTLQACGDRFGVTGATIHNHCKRLGLLDRKHVYKPMQLELPGLKALIEDDLLTIRECGERFGVSPTTVQKYCRLLGLKTQKSGPRDIAEEVHELKDLIEVKGLTQADCAEIYGVSQFTIHRHCKRLGIRAKAA